MHITDGRNQNPESPGILVFDRCRVPRGESKKACTSTISSESTSLPIPDHWLATHHSAVLALPMSICGCFSPNPRLGKNNSFEDDAEHPELAFTDKQNRFSQDVLTGLRGLSAPTTAVSAHAVLRCTCLLLISVSTPAAPLQRKHSMHFEAVFLGHCSPKSSVR